MAFKLNHLHLKSPDPEKTAQWYVDNLGATIVSEVGGGRGYRLTDKITVKEGVDPVNDRVQVPADPQNDPDGDPLNERQEWIVEQLQGSAELRIGQVVDQWKCSKTTAKRDLTGLREQGLIEFEGAARTGSWRLKG
mgnify:CR=1 FL=1